MLLIIGIMGLRCVVINYRTFKIHYGGDKCSWQHPGEGISGCEREGEAAGKLQGEAEGVARETDDWEGGGERGERGCEKD